MITAFAARLRRVPVRGREVRPRASSPGAAAWSTRPAPASAAGREDLIAHELAHQWWGDMITCADFQPHLAERGLRHLVRGVLEGTDGGRRGLPAVHGRRRLLRRRHHLSSRIRSTRRHLRLQPQLQQGQLGGAHAARRPRRRRLLRRPRRRTARSTPTAAPPPSSCATSLESVSAAATSTPSSSSGSTASTSRSTSTAGAPAPAPARSRSTSTQVQTNAGVFTMPITVRVTTDQGVRRPARREQPGQPELRPRTCPARCTDVLLDPDHWILRQVRTTVSNPPLDQGILLVNGVDWNTYSPEIQNAYQARRLLGRQRRSTSGTASPRPSGGYPATLPAPLGHGAVPADVLGQYSAVVWVGNNYNGDLADWQETPIPSYLEAGGNVLLLCRAEPVVPGRRAHGLPRRDLGRAGRHARQLRRGGARPGQHRLHRHPELQRRLPHDRGAQQHAALPGHHGLQRRRAAPAASSSRRSAAPTGPTAAASRTSRVVPYRMNTTALRHERRLHPRRTTSASRTARRRAVPGDDVVAARPVARRVLPESVQPADGGAVQPAARGERRAGRVRPARPPRA